MQVAYGTDLDATIELLCAAIAAVPRVLADPPAQVQLSAFASDGLELTLSFWIGDPHHGEGNVRSEVNLAVLRTLRQAGVEIPFPQRVLHGWPAAAAVAQDPLPPMPGQPGQPV